AIARARKPAPQPDGSPRPGGQRARRQARQAASACSARAPWPADRQTLGRPQMRQAPASLPLKSPRNTARMTLAASTTVRHEKPPGLDEGVMKEIVIRDAIRDDVPLIVQMIRQMVEDLTRYGGHAPATDRAALKKMKAMVAKAIKGDSKYLIAESADS